MFLSADKCLFLGPEADVESVCSSIGPEALGLLNPDWVAEWVQQSGAQSECFLLL